MIKYAFIIYITILHYLGGYSYLYCQNINPLLSKSINVENYINITSEVKSVKHKNYNNPSFINDTIVEWQEKGFSYNEILYNIEGIITKEKLYSFGLLHAVAIYRYDQQGKIINIKEYSKDGKYLGYSIFEYPNENRIIQKIISNEEREIWTFTYQLDNKKRIANYTQTKGSILIAKHVYKYNFYNQCKQVDVYKRAMDGYKQIFVLDYTKNYFYDVKNNLIGIYYPFEESPHYKYQYEFDDRGNCISRYGYINTGDDADPNYTLDSMLKIEIEYF